MSFARVKKLLEAKKTEALEFTGDYFPTELLLLIALQMSVFDVPALTVVCWFLARASNRLWRHHAERLYGRRQEYQLVQQLIKQETDSVKRLGINVSYLDKRFFFDMYRLTNLPSRRRALQITEGRLVDFVYENENGIPYSINVKKIKHLTTIELFNSKATFIHETRRYNNFGGFLNSLDSQEKKTGALEDSLFSLVHRLPDVQKMILLDHLYETVQQADTSAKYSAYEILRYPFSEHAHSILRRAFYLPDLTLKLYVALREHLSGYDIEPLYAAIKNNITPIITLLLRCKVELNEADKQLISAKMIEIEKWPCEMRHSLEDNLFMGYQFYINQLKDQERSTSVTTHKMSK